MDDRLVPMEQRKFQGLFSYSTYRLASHQEYVTQCGKLVVFNLPGGRILQVQPRTVEGDMIDMELGLFNGSHRIMTTNLKLKDRGTLIVGGPRYEQSMLIISIGASTSKVPLAGAPNDIPALRDRSPSASPQPSSR